MQRLILDNMNTAIITMDQQFSVRYLNSTAEALLDISLKRIQGQAITGFIDQADLLLEDLNRALTQKQQYTRRETQLHFQGDVLPVDYSVSPVNDEGACVLLEIHTRGRMQRISREESLIAKQETSRQLVRGLAHEIKNPLGGIRGAAQLLARELDSPSLNEFTDIIIQEADRLKDLVDRMLGPLKPPQMRPVNIHEVLGRIVQLIGAETDGQLNLQGDYDPSIPHIPADPERLIQAILNIVRNAMEAIESAKPLSSGTIHIRTRITRQFTIGNQKPRQVCHIAVTDNGPGIPPELVDSIFYPMISGRANGSGLGLPLAQSIISQHQGLIECDSQPGATCFHIYLPLKHTD